MTAIELCLFHHPFCEVDVPAYITYKKKKQQTAPWTIKTFCGHRHFLRNVFATIVITSTFRRHLGQAEALYYCKQYKFHVSDISRHQYVEIYVKKCSSWFNIELCGIADYFIICCTTSRTRNVLSKYTRVYPTFALIWLHFTVFETTMYLELF